MNVSHFYPRSPRGERLRLPVDRLSQKRISIHAPRVGSDPSLLCCPLWDGYFYPRSPRGERPWPNVPWTLSREFLSTLPAWGATLQKLPVPMQPTLFLSTLPAWGATGNMVRIRHDDYISIHAPRVGSDISASCGTLDRKIISIHAPRVGSDNQPDKSNKLVGLFLSTLPAWGATSVPHWSIPRQQYFYPRSPRGERP